MFQALAEKRIGRRDQANAWIWRLAEYTREVHEEYAVQRWPETKRLLGLLVNSSGGAHARNARRLVHAARKQDRRLQAALLAAAVAHTPEAEEVLRGARTRLARKPSALSRELLRNFPKGKGRRSRRRRKKAAADAAGTAVPAGANGARPQTGPDEHVLTEALAAANGAEADGQAPLEDEAREVIEGKVSEALETEAQPDTAAASAAEEEPAKPAPKPRRTRRTKAAVIEKEKPADAEEAPADDKPAAQEEAPEAKSAPKPRRAPRRKPAVAAQQAEEEQPKAAPKPRRRARAKPDPDDAPDAPPAEEAA
jgi:ribonuclease E